MVQVQDLRDQLNSAGVREIGRLLRWRFGPADVSSRAVDLMSRALLASILKMQTNNLGRLGQAARYILNGASARIRRFCQANSIALKMVSADGTVFRFVAFDRYWNGRNLESSGYEPEIFALLYSLRHVPFVFFDCGANFGYWSALVSGDMLGSHRAIAVEPSPITLQILKKTAAENNLRFDVVDRAISDVDDKVVTFVHTIDHVGSQVVVSEGGKEKYAQTCSVATIAVDSLLKRYSNDAENVIVKLDVEGQEISALDGGRQLKARDALVIFEDHGSDPDSKVTKALLDQGWRVYAPCVDINGAAKFYEITAIESLRQIKRIPQRGYNFFAIRSHPVSSWGNALGIEGP